MLQYSCAYHKRKHYMKCLQVPTISEAKNQLGNELAQVLMDECPESLKSQMRLSNPLHGPGENIWMSPSDLLIGKVVLKPPLTAKHVKALTHEGILNKGEEIEAQWLAAVELEKRQALENLEELLMMLAERDKVRSVQEALLTCGDEFQKHLDAVNAEFEAVLISELAALEASLRAYYEKLMEEQMATCQAEQDELVNEKINDAVQTSVLELTAKFMQDLAEQEKEMEAMFRARLAGQQERHLQALQHQEEVFAIVMKQLKHNLQCNNIASLMYVMCLERRKCMHEEQILTDGTTQRIAHLLEDNEVKERELKTLRCELHEKQRRLHIREDCLLGVIAQFQKFINYALRATPTQAEFLLSVEKMMTFEMTQALVRTQRGRKPHMAKMFMPWRKVSEESVPPPIADDVPYHDCLNEIDPPRCKTGEDELLALHYQKRIYIREDFRNAVTQGLYSPPGPNMLWSKDIEDLVKLIQNVNDDTSQMYTPTGDTPLISTDSVVHFIASVESPDPLGLLAVQDSISLRKSGVSPLPSAGIEDLGKPPSGVALLSVADSVTLMKEKHMGASVTARPPLRSDEIELEVIPAPSAETIRLNKLGRRRITPSDGLGLAVSSVSEVSLKLNLRKSSAREQRQSIQLRQPPMVRRSASKRSNLPPTRPSMISQHRDSLELIKSPSTAHNKKLKNIVMPAETVDPDYPTQQYVINAPTETRDFPEVNFKRIAEVFHELYRPEKPWRIYKKRPVSLTKKSSMSSPTINFLDQATVARVMGSASKELNKTQKDFTIHRIHSIMNVLKKDDSLIRLFTKCTQ